MSKIIKKVTEVSEADNSIFLVNDTAILKDFKFSGDEIDYANRSFDDSKTLVSINRLSNYQFIEKLNADNDANKESERLRKEGANIWKKLAEEKATSVCLFDLSNNPAYTLAIVEGLLLSSYQFSKYKTNTKELAPEITSVKVVSPAVKQSDLDELSELIKAVFTARDLVNETPEYLSAEKLAEAAEASTTQHGCSVTIFDKKEIEKLKMGGLLAVNKGSVNPPTFSIIEWKPEKPINTQPYVLVGKGVVYDTGGINLKTMPGSLDDMKCDMGGAAAVIGTMTAISANKLPIHVIGLVPSTDNRPGFNAYVPGDVITMHSGQTVEVMNTDAEGRLLLADALHYAKQYKPTLTIDLATLTGSAMMAIGAYGTVAMGNVDDATCVNLSNSGMASGEKVAWFPFWEEYDELIKSEIADMKNLGSREAGAISAGKFLSRFTDYDWIHLDIAGPAFLNKPLGYLNTGGTGVGVRLLYNYFKTLCR